MSTKTNIRIESVPSSVSDRRIANGFSLLTFVVRLTFVVNWARRGCVDSYRTKDASRMSRNGRNH